MKKFVSRIAAAALLALALTAGAGSASANTLPPPEVSPMYVNGSCNYWSSTSCLVTAPGPTSGKVVNFQANATGTSTATQTATVTRNGVFVCSTTYRAVDPAKSFSCFVAGGAFSLNLLVTHPFGQSGQGTIQY